MTLNEVQVPHSHRYTQLNDSIMNTDKSNSILSSLSPQNSLSQMKDFHRYEQVNDRFDREVYPPINETYKEVERIKK
jgi:hypothetical protein